MEFRRRRALFASGGGHGSLEFSPMFVNGYARFGLYNQLNPGTLGNHSLDWTEGGLQGADLC